MYTIARARANVIDINATYLEQLERYRGEEFKLVCLVSVIPSLQTAKAGYFGLVRLSRLGHDVLWTKA
jgi:hypothetical protein